MTIDIFIVRNCMLPLRNPLVIDNIPVFSQFNDAYKYAKKFLDTNKLTIKENIFDNNNRYYVYEDFISEQFIWIEKHSVS